MVARAIKTGSKGLAACLAMGMLMASLYGQSSAADPPTSSRKNPAPIRLFGTIEFRSHSKTLPQWARVLSVAGGQIDRYRTCKKDACSSAAKSWRQMIRLAVNKPPMEKLKTVNAFFNQWPYRLDVEAYDKSDYWASPNEFLKVSGDCEDYSIIKYFALQQIGFTDDAMRIVVLKDQIRNIDHAVLAVYIKGTAFILDNMSDMVLPHNTYRHYLPQYSVNGANRWAHIRPIGKQGF